MASGYVLNAGALGARRCREHTAATCPGQPHHIEQAKGVLAERHHITPAEAFERLRSHARHTQARVHDLAAQIVDDTATL